MVDARWYMILKEFEDAATIESDSNLTLRRDESPRDSDAPSLSRNLKVGLALAALLLATILIGSLPAV